MLSDQRCRTNLGLKLEPFKENAGISNRTLSSYCQSISFNPRLSIRFVLAYQVHLLTTLPQCLLSRNPLPLIVSSWQRDTLLYGALFACQTSLLARRHLRRVGKLRCSLVQFLHSDLPVKSPTFCGSQYFSRSPHGTSSLPHFL